MLVRDGLVVDILNVDGQHCVSNMGENWCMGRKPMVLGGIYREHQYLEQGKPNPTCTEQQEILRWNKFVQTWSTAARNSKVVILGDTNLDFLRWQQPEHHLKKKMVEKVKDPWLPANDTGSDKDMEELARLPPGPMLDELAREACLLSEHTKPSTGARSRGP